MNTDAVWHNLIDYVSSVDGFIGPVEYKEVAGAGRGLFLTAQIEPSTSLVVIPQRALINNRTIGCGYPHGLVSSGVRLDKAPSSGTSRLNSTQALSMHLYLKRRGLDADTSPETYMGSLPDAFHEHPLTWLDLASSTGDTTAQSLLRCIPPSPKRMVMEVHQRFCEDWKAVQIAMASHGIEHTADSHDFLWAWLCVNTRCIHYSLDPEERLRSRKDVDLTLCPVIDFANHTIDESQSAQVHRNDDGSLELTSPDIVMEEGAEVVFRYSGHSNAALFSEYGFAISRSHSQDRSEGEIVDEGDINVDDLMEQLFLCKEDGSWRREMLEAHGYWGDWTLRSSPECTQPSYRLLPALRILHLEKPVEGTWTTAGSRIKGWEAMINGQQTVVDHENELDVRTTLREICQKVLQRAEQGLARMRQLRAVISTEHPNSADRTGWAGQASQCIEILWKEEHEVASAMIYSIDRGDALE